MATTADRGAVEADFVVPPCQRDTGGSAARRSFHAQGRENAGLITLNLPISYKEDVGRPV